MDPLDGVKTWTRNCHSPGSVLTVTLSPVARLCAPSPLRRFVALFPPFEPSCICFDVSTFPRLPPIATAATLGEMLSQRLAFGALMIAALIGLFWLDQRLDSAPQIASSQADAVIHAGVRRGLIITTIWMLLAAFATRELGALLRTGGHRPAVTCAMGFNILLALIPWTIGSGLAARWGWTVSETSTTAAVLTAAVMLTFVCVARRRRVEGASTDVSQTLLMVLYLGLLGSFIPRLRMGLDSPWTLMWVLLVIKCCDIGAYFTGLAMGRHKLIPWLSPGKTWEGLIGGVATAMLVSAAVSIVSHGGWDAATRPAGIGDADGRGDWPALSAALAFGAIMALVGQAGDLFESLLKRDAGAKDSGAVVPAFGGLLDILDSPLFCIPVAYAILIK